MCGIAGFLGFELNIELAKAANIIQKHRGPDSQGIWNDNYIALAHQRLSIIDLSERSNQPFEKDNLIIIFNGEIYNYKEIKEQLIKEYNSQFRTESDTEVVLEAYKHLKEKSLDLFIGMFSFAIYNKIEKTLFLARDHFGIKPLFYSFIDNGFAFASELKTLLVVPNFDKTINYRSLISSLNYLWVSGEESMFKNTFKLPPAHYMIINSDLSYKIESYWELKENIVNQSEEKHIEDLKKVIEESVERHMVSDVPVSTFLSGGLDSSLISVLAKRHNKKLSTYTIGTENKDKKFEKTAPDEYYAALLADKHNFDHNEIIIKSDIIKSLPQMVRSLDEPIGDPAALNTYLICKAAREKGTIVLLSGMGPDEAFSGYRRQKGTLYAMRYQKFPSFIKSPIESIVNKLPIKTSKAAIKPFRWAKQFLKFANLPEDQIFMGSYSYYSKDELKKLLKNNHDSDLNRMYKEHETIFKSMFHNDKVNQMCQTEIKTYMKDLNLTYSDRASMAASVEVRVPFIDKKVIEQAMRIPGNLKLHGNESKYIVKKVAESFLPKSVIYRPKSPFTAPLRSWISNDLRAMIDELLSKENVEKRGIFNYDAIKKLINDDRSGLSDNASRIYQLITIELWCREFVDKDHTIKVEYQLNSK